MHRNTIQIQIDKRVENGQMCWVVSHTPDWARRQLEEVTLVLLIEHDWSENEDRYSYEVWTLDGRTKVLPDRQIGGPEDLTYDAAYAQFEENESAREDEWPETIVEGGVTLSAVSEEFPYEVMSRVKEKLFRQMVERWKALNMFATFQVTW